MVLLSLLVSVQQIVSGQTWQAICNNTQSCSGVSIDIYDVSWNLLYSGIVCSQGDDSLSTCGVMLPISPPAACSSLALPEHLIFNEGGCSVTVSVGNTVTCSATPPPTCNCSCISSGRSYAVTVRSPPPSTCNFCNYMLIIYMY